MNRAEHIRQMRAIAKSHMVVSMASDDDDALAVACSHYSICHQMIDDQERCEAFAVAFWHRVFHRHLREHGEK
jgi:hypothetical protein